MAYMSKDYYMVCKCGFKHYVPPLGDCLSAKDVKHMIAECPKCGGELEREECGPFAKIFHGIFKK